MKLIIGKFIDTNSWVHRLDPRTKIISIFLLIILTFLINDLEQMLYFLALVVVLVLTTKISFLKFLKGLKPVLFILIFTVFFQLFYNKTGDLLYSLPLYFNIYNIGLGILTIILYAVIKKVFKPSTILFLIAVVLFVISFTISFNNESNYLFNIYSTGLDRSLYLFVRIICLVILSSVLTFTTKPLDLNTGLERVIKPLKVLKVPTEELAMMISISLRFIPTLFEETNKIIKAQSSRGVDFTEAKLTSKVSQIISLLIPMFVISLKRADDLSNAMIARAYVPGEKRTRLNKLRYRFSDYFAYFLILLISLYVIIL